MRGRGILAAIIADDLTGAMDAAAPFARRGLDVQVLTTPVEADSIVDLPQVLSVNTNTRHVSEETAAHIVSKVAADLRKLKPELLIKKIDSTLRGNVVAETLAAMQATGRGKVIVCPAIPSQGRTLLRGELFIDSVPLRDSAIGRDLRSPPPLAPLQDLFRAAKPGLPVSISSRNRDWESEDILKKQGIYIPDAKSNEQLLAIARSAREYRANILFSGASGLTESLAEELYGVVNLVDTPPVIGGKALFVVGSLAPQAAAQVETLTRQNSGVRVFKLTESPADNRRALQHLAQSEEAFTSLVIRPPEVSDESTHDSDYIVKALADCSAVFLKYARVGMLLATGGDTAAALLARLNLKVITIAGEVQPGVVHGLLNSPQGPLRLVTKAGGFGDDRLFCEILDYFN